MYIREIENFCVVVLLLKYFWLGKSTLQVIDEYIAIQSVLNEPEGVFKHFSALGAKSFAAIFDHFLCKSGIFVQILCVLLAGAFGAIKVKICASLDHQLLDTLIEESHGVTNFKLLYKLLAILDLLGPILLLDGEGDGEVLVEAVPGLLGELLAERLDPAANGLNDQPVTKLHSVVEQGYLSACEANSEVDSDGLIEADLLDKVGEEGAGDGGGRTRVALVRQHAVDRLHSDRRPRLPRLRLAVAAQTLRALHARLVLAGRLLLVLAKILLVRKRVLDLLLLLEPGVEAHASRVLLLLLLLGWGQVRY